MWWSEIEVSAASGDSEITSYNLQWDVGTSGTEWHDLVGNPVQSLEREFTISSMVSPGDFYRFRLRASNIYGFGDFSSEFEFKAAQEPQQLSTEAITSQNDGT